MTEDNPDAPVPDQRKKNIYTESIKFATVGIAVSLALTGLFHAALRLGNKNYTGSFRSSLSEAKEEITLSGLAGALVGYINALRNNDKIDTMSHIQRLEQEKADKPVASSAPAGRSGSRW